jgi:hypothetical protein
MKRILPQRPKIWDYDQDTLDKAWQEYKNLPVTDRRRKRFGRWFLEQFHVPQLISWPSVFFNTDDYKAYLMLSEVATK